MRSYIISTLLDLPELTITKASKENDHYLIEVEPVEHPQDCPICGSTHTLQPFLQNFGKMGLFIGSNKAKPSNMPL